MVSLTRSGSFMSSPRQQQQQQQQLQQLPRMPSTDGGTGAASDDSMHEKYFKSVENTPVTRRRNVAPATASATSVQQKHSSDSSPQSPISPQNNAQKATRPSVLSSLATTFTDAPNPCLSSHKDDADLINLDLVSKPER